MSSKVHDIDNLFDCTASIVVYNNPPEMIRRTAESFLSCSLKIELHIIDNSPTEALKPYLVDLPIIYHFYGSNAGYGQGHNLVINNRLNSRYHIIINPDIIIPPYAIESLYSFMDKNLDIGVVCPKVLNEDGSIQPLNKRYPTVFDLFVRRFIPKSLYYLLQRRIDQYEMKDVGYDNITDVECVSGCFMFCRSGTLKVVGGFDDRYFMYFEDFDLSRKIQQAGYRTVYYPMAAVIHLWERASHNSLKMTCVHIQSAVKFFNKWGWKFF